MDKKVEDLGNISGKVLLFGGVYSNLQALEKLISISEELDISPSNCICTGDIIGYCAQPEETLQLFRKWGAKSIAGNVEIQLAEGADNCGCDFTKGSRCDNFSQMWYPFAKSRLSRDSINYMENLSNHIQFTYCDMKFTVVHGSYFNTSEFIFESTPWETKHSNFIVSKSDAIIAGHCGLPFSEEKENRLWINPGVIGMPANDGSSKVWYVVLDDENGTFNFQHFSYDYDSKLAQELMNSAELPKEYSKTIIDGIWDNMDILPEAERRKKGAAILL